MGIVKDTRSSFSRFNASCHSISLTLLNLFVMPKDFIKAAFKELTKASDSDDIK
jgi:hypothetical protein